MNQQRFLIYLDVCCLNRPFDDLAQERIRLESEAVLLILQHCQNGDWDLLGSEAIDAEIAQIPNADRKQRVMLWSSLVKTKLNLTAEIESRVQELTALGFKGYDVFHIVFAEAGNADIFLTTDDRLLRLATRHKTTVQVRVENPIIWLLEVTK